MTKTLGAIFLAAATAAWAQGAPPVPAASNGNLPNGFYPRPPCAAPDRKSGQRDPVEYNRLARAYNPCMKSYAANAPNDVAHVLFTVNSAVAAARGSAPPAAPAPGDGNLPADFYPKPDCTRPNRAAIPARPSPSDTKAMEAYNQAVATYNVEVNAFSGCIQDYVGRAQSDVQAINDTVHDAVSAH